MKNFSAPQAKEVRIVLKILVRSIHSIYEEYIARDGYIALGKVLTEMTPEETIQEVWILACGAWWCGFSSWIKMALYSQCEAAQKFMICNADEGDPGAFAIGVLEGDPHSVVEGMTSPPMQLVPTGLYLLPCRIPIAVRR